MQTHILGTLSSRSRVPCLFLSSNERPSQTWMDMKMLKNSLHTFLGVLLWQTSFSHCASESNVKAKPWLFFAVCPSCNIQVVQWWISLRSTDQNVTLLECLGLEEPILDGRKGLLARAWKGEPGARTRQQLIKSHVFDSSSVAICLPAITLSRCDMNLVPLGTKLHNIPDCWGSGLYRVLPR